MTNKSGFLFKLRWYWIFQYLDLHLLLWLLFRLLLPFYKGKDLLPCKVNHRCLVVEVDACRLVSQNVAQSVLFGVVNPLFQQDYRSEPLIKYNWHRLNLIFWGYRPFSFIIQLLGTDRFSFFFLLFWAERLTFIFLLFRTDSLLFISHLFGTDLFTLISQLLRTYSFSCTGLFLLFR